MIAFLSQVQKSCCRIALLALVGAAWACGAAAAVRPEPPAFASAQALAALPASPRGPLIGQMQIYTAKYEDTLPDLAIRFDVGFVALQAANPGVDTWLPGAGTTIVVPTAHLLPVAPHKGLVLNIPEMRVYFFTADGGLATYPIGIGRDGWETPTGATQVVRKTKNPAWNPPASIREEKPWLPVSMPSGPDNPLGFRALYLGWPAFLIHGTNTPYGVGRRASHGCIRLYESDIEKLYPRVPVGTPVHAVNQELKAATIDGELYVEADPSIAQALEIEDGRPITPAFPQDMVGIVLKAAGDPSRIDWDLLKKVALERRGYPVRVTR